MRRHRRRGCPRAWKGLLRPPDGRESEKGEGHETSILRSSPSVVERYSPGARALADQRESVAAAADPLVGRNARDSTTAALAASNVGQNGKQKVRLAHFDPALFHRLLTVISLNAAGPA